MYSDNFLLLGTHYLTLYTLNFASHLTMMNNEFVCIYVQSRTFCLLVCCQKKCETWSLTLGEEHRLRVFGTGR
jgi:hypothetical protein